MFNWFKRPLPPPAPAPVVKVVETVKEEPVKVDKPKRKYTKSPLMERRKRSMDARNKDIARRYAEERLTKASLARIYGLTHARTIQILKAEGAYTAPASKVKPVNALPDPKRKQAAKLFDEGLAQKDIAAQMGVSISTVGRSVRRYSKTVGVRSWTEEDEKNLAALWPDDSVSIKEIAEMIGVSEAAVKCKARRLNLHR